MVKHTINLIGILAFTFFLSANIHAQTPCPKVATITANDKCVFLSWETAPIPLPNSTFVDGELYTYQSGAGTGSSPANYRNSSPGGGACNANQSNLFTGSISFDGINTCEFVDGSLGVEWLDFKVRRNKEGVLITWSVIADEFNEFFEVEKSLDGDHWTTIGDIKNRSISEIEEYSFLDREVGTGVIYYRVIQFDFSGEYTYSESRSIFIESNEKVDFYVRDKELFIESISEDQIFEGQIMDMAGNIVYPFRIQNESSYDFGHLSFVPGIYIISIKNGNQVLTKRFFLN